MKHHHHHQQQRQQQRSTDHNILSSSPWSLLLLLLLLLLLSTATAATAATKTTGFTSLRQQQQQLQQQQQQQLQQQSQRRRNLQSNNNNNNLDNIPYPYQRFKLWDDLSTTQLQNAAAIGCSYEEDTWNLPGTNEIEYLSFETMELQQNTNCLLSLGQLGFIESNWDCYMNHYNDYSWDELAEYNVESYWEVLGWNQQLWDGGAGTDEGGDSNLQAPETNEMFWTDLSTRQQQAASQLCYTQQLWDGIESFDDWDDALLPESPAPTPFPTVEPTTSIEPSLQPTSYPTSTPTLTPYPTISPYPTQVPSSSPSTQEPTTSIEPTASYQPSSSPITPPTPNPTVRQSDSSVQVYKNRRYIVWSNLHSEIKQYAAKLFYNEKLWNMPGTNSIELLSYWSITTDKTTYPNGLEGMKGIGFTEEEWDCHVNHYGDYAWSDLESVDVDQYWIDLGWNQEKWDTSGSAATDNKYWDELTPKEQKAATNLCYQCELWNQIPLEDWGTKRATHCRHYSNSSGSSIQIMTSTTVVVGIIGMSFLIMMI